MTPEPPQWLSWFADVGSSLGLLALVGVPLYKKFSPEFKDQQARGSHKRRKNRLASLQRQLLQLQRFREHPEIAVLVTLRHTLFAAFYLLLPYVVESQILLFVHGPLLIHMTNGFSVGGLKLFGGEACLVTIFLAFGDVDKAIDPAHYEKAILDSISELQKLDEYQKPSIPLAK